MFRLMNRFSLFFTLLYLTLSCFLVLSKITDELWIFHNLNLGKCFTNICSVVKKMELNPFMLTITSYFGFLLAALTITSALFIGLNKIRLIWNELNEKLIKTNISLRFRVFYGSFSHQLPILGHWDSRIIQINI